jgi:hypothetical protein
LPQILAKNQSVRQLFDLYKKEIIKGTFWCVRFMALTNPESSDPVSEAKNVVWFAVWNHTILHQAIVDSKVVLIEGDRGE